MGKVLNIVLTGGPYAGKSSNFELIKQYFYGCGYQTYIVLESATKLINSGLNPKNLGIDIFQEIILRYQLYKDNLIRTLVNNIKVNSIVIYDRNLLDNKARYENDKEAIEIDDKVFDIWRKHLIFKKVKCYEDFEEKQNIILDICKDFKQNFV